MFIASLIINWLAHLRQKPCKLRKDFVGKEERNIVFGNQKTWVDVEADEATFDKRDISQDPALQHLVVKKNETIMWEQWGGVTQRGRPRTLVLRKLIPKLTVKRAPGPGAIRKTEWNTIANEFLLDRKVILHTDSAKSYKAKVRGFARQSGTLQEAGEGEWQVQVVEPQICRYRYPTRSLALRRN